MNASTNSHDRLEAVFDLLERLESGAPERVRKYLGEFDPDAARIVPGFAFADVMSRPGIAAARGAFGAIETERSAAP